MRKVRVGIVGCGVIGTLHLEAALSCPLIEVTAVADRIGERRKRAADQIGGAGAFAEGTELIERADVEAVVLAVPAGDRRALPLVALGRGLHTLIEKPAAFSAAELRGWMAAQGDRVAGCCSSRMQGLGATRAAAAAGASGALGALRSVHCRAIGSAGPRPAVAPPAWRLSKERNAGGILCNWGCYDIDYLMTITAWRLRPELVLAQTWGLPAPFVDHAAPGSDGESHYTAMIRCAGGVVVTLERAEYAAAASEAAWRVVGELGSLELDMLGQGGVRLHTADAEVGVRTRLMDAEPDEPAGMHGGPITDFASAILEGRTPRTDLGRALVVQQITDAIYASAASGEAVRIEREEAQV